MAISDKDKVREYWDSRAELGPEAGTQDLIARELEIRAIEQFIRDGMTILDAGCGNGTTAIELAERHSVKVIGIDFSSKMITSASKLAEKSAEDGKLSGCVDFFCRDITCEVWGPSYFDLVYTQRAIINLPDWETQKATIELLGTYLKPGGKYLMCECSQDGLDAINRLRKKVGLSDIIPPWHNHYLHEMNLHSFGEPFKNMTLLWEDNFSSTYYFLSRVVNAWLAKQEGKEPDYNSPVNQLALRLPPFFGNFGQVKLWVWTRI